MSAILSAVEIATHALREIGELSIYDGEPDAVALQVSLQRLDMLVAELAGTEGVWWLRPLQVDLPLVSGVQDVSLAAVTPRMEFFSSATLLNSTDAPPYNERPVRLIYWTEYNAIRQKTQAGQPTVAYIERVLDPTASLHPVPGTDGLILRLAGQAYADDLTLDHGQVDHGMPAAWQNWMILSLAATIGGGPVRTIPASDRGEKRGMADKLLSKLMARNNRANIDRPRTVRMYMP